jgi:hypothetical protein
MQSARSDEWPSFSRVTFAAAAGMLRASPRRAEELLDSILEALEEKPTSPKVRYVWAMSRLMLKSAKRALLIENLRILRGLGKMRVR